MTAHNDLPDRRVELPISALEAFQAGYGAYISICALTAVPADAVAPTYGAHGGWLSPTSERLADQLAYLRAAEPT
jgi:hypothetical protein